MNLLVQNAPDYIMVGGKKIHIKTDFALWVSFLIACENENPEGILTAVSNIVENMPEERDELAGACMHWLFGNGENKAEQPGTTSSRKMAFDFAEDGNIIYCELWEYFPHLMKRGISFHEGMELIKILLHNENTLLWHRAFARCGDFSKMDKEQRKYWQRQRAIYMIKNKYKSADADVMCGDFW